MAEMAVKTVTTLDRVAQICSEHLGVDEKEVTRNASFRDDLGADSLDLVELAMAFEEEFGIPEISDEDGERIMRNVGDAVDYIERQKGARDARV